MINTDMKELSFTIDTKQNRYYFGIGIFYFWFTRVNRHNINDYTCITKKFIKRDII